ncbi:hypothetical protein [endosymbiont of Riftia pachyptila]|uniref:Uncharacterized protein n=1 Tax=endosymbiont of Riftia pachyptila (vent Ph05) TaxID=1048808 RepID=G2DG37_9GAMM|nr:hypothetical protein [endosymbiont of Riftia pachyptila]EGV50405.1 hypothetical protein Rifp1Sym_de00020 [endosymbiont of Riftia pachyptila (vent Ph05)]
MQSAKPIRLFTLSLLLFGCLAGVRAEESKAPPANKDPRLYEGAIYYGKEDQIEDIAVPLGGVVGSDTVDGINVGLYVFQASSPERHQPGAKGPTHLFNITFTEEEDGNLIEQVLGALIIQGQGPQKESRHRIHPFKSHQQVAVRLEQEGEYQLSVEYLAKGQQGKTKAFPFVYVRKK